VITLSFLKPTLRCLGLFIILTSACQTLPQDTPTPLEPHTVTGVVLDTQGQPLEGAIIRLRADFLTGWVEVTSGSDGRYKASSDVQTVYASYTIEAFKQTEYNTQTICSRLAMPDPNDYNSFTMNEGAEKNFQWQLTGKVGNYENFFGATINIANSYLFYDTTKAVEFTLTPTAPLLDGSEGSVIVKEVALEAPANENALLDIPVGTYTLQGVLIGHDGSRTPINVATESSVTYTSEVEIAWHSTGECGFGSDSGVEPVFLELDEQHPMSLQSQPTEFGN
jgi:hypothetical protein